MWIINLLNIFISNPYLLLVMNAVAFTLKISLLCIILYFSIYLKRLTQPWVLLVLVLSGALFIDICWIMLLLKKTSLYVFQSGIMHSFLTISWIFHVIEYQSFALLVATLLKEDKKILHRIFLYTSVFLILTYLGVVTFKFFNPLYTINLEYVIQKTCSFYIYFMLSINIFTAFQSLRRKKLPKILRKQLSILIQFLIIPNFISDLAQIVPYLQGNSVNNYTINVLSTMLLTIAFYFCAKKMMGLRFLNTTEHVQSAGQFDFINDFNRILEQLSQVTNIKELNHIIQAFFKEAFSIQAGATTLYLRHALQDEPQEQKSSVESTTELFITKNYQENFHNIAEFMFQTKILVKDELAFNNFNEHNPIISEILTFLEHINADVFIPIFEKNAIIAYIIIQEHARKEEFYTKIERDEMLVFSKYLANIINLLQNRNLNALIHQEKERREELYLKHQEINQYKESIRSFLHNDQQRKIGILFYKNRKFIYANQAAKDLISVNPNVHEGHPLSKALKYIAHQVHTYKTAQTSIVHDQESNKIVLTGLPHLEANTVIITAHYPELSDILKEQLTYAKNPSEWDYILYLETTKTGKLINQLIPGSGEHILNFKIDLLKMALSNKAILLDMPTEDLMATVEILHHISLREQLHILKLHAQEKNNDTAIKLFGMNKIFNKNESVALLDKLNGTGTLFIQNIHFLDLETQEYLAEFIGYGYYRVFKSDQKIISNVRIICSTNQNIQTLIHANKFSKNLYNELSTTTLSMPPLVGLSEKELSQLADGYTQQAIKTDTFSNLLELSPKEKIKLINMKPMSLQEFKTKIQNLLVNKSKKNNILEEAQFDPAYNITDPELIEAARLGKKALKNSKIMLLLWNKFGNQNKIASFLGVNRSSVNRRLKEYDVKID